MALTQPITPHASSTNMVLSINRLSYIQCSFSCSTASKQGSMIHLLTATASKPVLPPYQADYYTTSTRTTFASSSSSYSFYCALAFCSLSAAITDLMPS